MACISFFVIPAFLFGHDSFLRPTEYFPEANSELEIIVFNGTFNESVDSIPKDVVKEIAIQTSSGTPTAVTSDWIRGEVGSKAWRILQRLHGLLGVVDDRRTSTLVIPNLPVGTQAIGVTLHELRTAMSPETFHAYMEESGLTGSAIAGILNGDPNQVIRERYIKAMKTIVHTGGAESVDPLMPVGQVVEIVPLENPGTVRKDGVIRFLALFNGNPVPNQVILAGKREGVLNRGSHDRITLVTDESGIVSLPIDDRGDWWLKFNHIRIADSEDPMDLVTHWATLTFTIN